MSILSTGSSPATTFEDVLGLGIVLLATVIVVALAVTALVSYGDGLWSTR